MAKTKAELQADWTTHHAYLAKAHELMAAKRFDEAIDLAIASFDYLDGMMSYAKKYEDTVFETVPAIDFVLANAPLRFRYDSLNRLEEVLRAQRGIQRKASQDLSRAISIARNRMQDARALWALIDATANTAQRKTSSTAAAEILVDWHRMGLVRRSPDVGGIGYCLTTQMGETALAKCFNCGVVAKAPKIRLLSSLNCPKCHTDAGFVILPTTDTKRR